MGAWDRAVVALDEKCTGVLVDAMSVVTAGHCSPVASVMGAGGSWFRNVDMCLVHHEAAPGSGFDVAVCRLDSPAPVPVPELHPYVGEIPRGTRLLMAGASPLVGRPYRWWWGRLDHVGRELVVSVDPWDLCPGDSGGPAFIEGHDGLHLVGIASSRRRFDVCNSVAVRATEVRYTQLSRVEEWLRSSLDALRAGHPAQDAAAGREL